LTAVIILLLTAYAIIQRVQYRRTLNRDYWKINLFEIEFVVPRKRRRALTSTANTYEDAPTTSVNCLGRWNVHEVAARPLRLARMFSVNWKVKQTLMRMREVIEHENIARFFGISSHNNGIYLVEQYCANGTIVEFFRYNKYTINQSLRYVACADIANGMAYLHRQNLIHGNLSIGKCHVDSRWTIKIVDWEYTALYDAVRRTNRNRAQATCDNSVLNFICDEGSRAFRHLAPEIETNGCLLEPTRAGDVYSFGIIIQDMFFNLLVQQSLPQTSAQICNEMPAKARQIMELACHDIAINRPTFEQLEKSMRNAIISGQRNLLDRSVRVHIATIPLLVN